MREVFICLKPQRLRIVVSVGFASFTVLILRYALGEIDG